MKTNIKTKYYLHPGTEAYDLSEVPYVEYIPSLFLVHNTRKGTKWVNNTLIGSLIYSYRGANFCWEWWENCLPYEEGRWLLSEEKY